MRYTVEIGERLVPVDVVDLGNGRYRVRIDQGEAQVVDAAVDDVLVHLLSGDMSVSVTIGQNGTGQQAHARGTAARLTVLDARSARRRARERESGLSIGGDAVRSPMPGRVVEVLVSEGDAVTAGQGIVIVEAMKMENELRAEIDGVVKTVHVSADDRVEGNALLVSLTPAHEGTGE